MLFCYLIVIFCMHLACVRKVVPPSSPSEEMGSYWGYKVRYASNLSGVINGSPYKVLLVMLLQWRYEVFSVFFELTTFCTEIFKVLYLTFFTTSRKDMIISLALQSMAKPLFHLSSSYLHSGIQSAYFFDKLLEEKNRSDLSIWMCKFVLPRWYGVTISEEHFLLIHYNFQL